MTKGLKGTNDGKVTTNQRKRGTRISSAMWREASSQRGEIKEQLRESQSWITCCLLFPPLSMTRVRKNSPVGESDVEQRSVCSDGIPTDSSWKSRLINPQAKIAEQSFESRATESPRTDLEFLH